MEEFLFMSKLVLNIQTFNFLLIVCLIVPTRVMVVKKGKSNVCFKKDTFLD